MGTAVSVAPPAVSRSGEGRARRWLRRLGFGLSLLLALALAAAIAYEVRTSALEAWLVPRLMEKVSFAVQEGPSPRIAFPDAGPFDVQRGYSRLPDFESRLERDGYRVSRQAVMSEDLQQIVSLGISPPYREVPVAGLRIYSGDGGVLYDTTAAERSFESPADVPPLLASSLLYLENRELTRPRDRRSNPVIEWDRQAKATLLYFGNKLGFPIPVQGGSTLGTQMEKYRHSPRGRTNSPADKLRQLAGATLKAYRDGADTRPFRNEVVVDYLNSIPLSAPPGWGEVHGLGEGLYAWFGLRLPSVRDALADAETTPAKVIAYKHALALLVSLPAPTYYLRHDRAALDERTDAYAQLLADAGVIPSDFADAVQRTPLLFLPQAPIDPPSSTIERKGLNSVRTALLRLLGAQDYYDLDRLHLEVDSTLDAPLQQEAADLLRRMTDPAFVKAHGLKGKWLLQTGDPAKVVYSLVLFERTPRGNLLRVHADNLDRPFDINDGVKMALGSTAKLRTLAHYLEILTSLHRELSAMAAGDSKALERQAEGARDPITQWAMKTLAAEPRLALEPFLERALDRRYSASPYEVFFTGSGQHHFNNFDRDDNDRILSVRDALRHSVNLVFIRLMRDLVRFHEARLTYDADAVLADPDNPLRREMLLQAADEEAQTLARRAYRRYRLHDRDEVVTRLLGSRADSPKHLAILYYAWRGAGGDAQAEATLADWLHHFQPRLPDDEIARLESAYDNPRLGLLDYAYLLGRHPLQLWTAGALAREPGLTWEEVFERSAGVRQQSLGWLLHPRHRRAQNLRLRIRIERDAFERMTPYWQKLAFPFRRLVPSYATAIGDSSDRPAALADLMGIIVNDGIRLPSLRLTRLQFAEGTPYETVFEPAPDAGRRVMEPEVAKVLRESLADVVERGTAARLAGAFQRGYKPVAVGGKTGSGDNRFETFTRWGAVTSSQAVNRTATFVFYIGDRYYGVLTAYVDGEDAAAYSFTSALPVTILRLFAPVVNARL